jgi:alpha-1,2-glucosyltransferase
MSPAYMVYCTICVLVLKELNTIVTEPYMASFIQFLQQVPGRLTLLPCMQDEPFHIPQAQAYCEGDYAKWDPKITTPPGLCVPSPSRPVRWLISLLRYT